MRPGKFRPGMTIGEVVASWGKILSGRAPMLSIEITRECPLHCPGCYAYNDGHVGADRNLRDLSDLRGDALVQGVLALIDKHKPLHVSLVGGEPLIRHRELSRILPELSARKIHSMVVTSAVIPIPAEWMQYARNRVAVSVDGLPEHHDERRKPATYERILENIRGRRVNIHWTITHATLERPTYLEEYLQFWNARAEVSRIWVSLYSPQIGEHTAEMLTHEDRERLALELPKLRGRFPKLLISDGIAKAFLEPPADPQACLFARMSTNYSADLKTRVEPCVLGGTPDCSQCGCVASSGLHYLQSIRIGGSLRIGSLVRASMACGTAVNRIWRDSDAPLRWERQPLPSPALVQIDSPK
jgi:MoaA/NifB/PqqE/SkfB family radical SAM enzyme